MYWYILQNSLSGMTWPFFSFPHVIDIIDNQKCQSWIEDLALNEYSASGG